MDFLATATATDAQLDAWAAGAGLFEDSSVASAVAADDVPRTYWEAFTRLEVGDPDGALQVLGADPWVPPAAPNQWTDLLALAARSLRGDLPAWQVLASVRISGESRARFTRILARAAGRLPDRSVADGAWLAHVEAVGTQEPEALVHACVARVARRVREDVDDVAAALAAVAGAVRPLWDNAPELGPALTDRICGELAERGDVAGAALVSDVLTRVRPSTPELTAVRDRWQVPRIWWRHLALRVLPILGAVVLGAVAYVYLGVAAARIIGTPLALLGGWWGWNRAAVTMYPQHTPAESRLRAAYAGLKIDPMTGAASIGTPGAAPVTVGGIAGFVVLMVVALWLGDADGPFGPSWASRWSGWLFLAAFVGGPVLGAVATLRVRRRIGASRAAHERARQSAHREAAPTCRCWQSTAMVGDLAVQYATSHLVGTAIALPSAVQQRLLSMLPSLESARVVGCAHTGTAWLWVTAHPVVPGRPLRHRHLLVSAPPALPAQGASDEVSVVGGYL